MSILILLDKGEESEWFNVKTGVKQGYVTHGFIFLIVVDWITRNTTAGNKPGIRWNFTSKLEDLDFADDIALMPSCYTHMQTKTRHLNQFVARTGLKINKKKRKVLRINSKCENRILIDDQELKELGEYNYMCAIVSKQGGGGDDIVNIIRKARVSFMKLKQKWLSNIYTLRFKLRLFNKLVKPVLLYGSETWKKHEGDNRKLDTFFK